MWIMHYKKKYFICSNISNTKNFAITISDKPIWIHFYTALATTYTTYINTNYNLHVTSIVAEKY